MLCPLQHYVGGHSAFFQFQTGNERIPSSGCESGWRCHTFLTEEDVTEDSHPFRGDTPTSPTGCRV